MFRVRGSNSPSLVTGILWDAFSAGGIISELLRSGFADHDVNAIGVLEGHAPAVSEFLLAIGLPSDVAAFYGDFFDDGAVLLLIRVNPPRRKKTALELLKHYGGESVRSTLQSGRAAVIQRRDALYDLN